ncbi:MAG: nicotinate-nucleotide adenylyltransferase [Planctomycetota bacterium]
MPDKTCRHDYIPIRGWLDLPHALPHNSGLVSIPIVGENNKLPMRLGLLGGTFDPVHVGHLILAQCALEQCRLDEVWFLPAAIAPHKQDRAPALPEHRLAMLELATAGNEQFRVCGYEIDRGGVNYTVDTLRHLREEDAARELCFLLGADMLNDLPNWREAGEVCRLATPVAVRRAGSPEPDFTALSHLTDAERMQEIRRHQVEMPEIGISSTGLRRQIAAGRSIRYRVPHAVACYIEQHGLYR